jgi:RHS repeat-associated protein
VGHTTQFTYDAGDLVAVTDPLGNTTSRFIDAAGRLLSLTNPMGNLTRYDYDALNRLKKVTDALGGLTQFNYDPNGNLLNVTDARSNVTSYTYDNMDRLATRKDPLQLPTSTESYLYDGNGNLTQFTDRKGQVTLYEYDALNRRTKATYADLSTTTYNYDAGNRLTSIVDSVSGTITRNYDNLDRLTSEITPQGSVTYGYDAASRRTSMTVAGQPSVVYSYDNANRLTQITQGTSTVTIGYDAASRRTSLTLPNNVVVQYDYDNANRVTGITYKLGVTVLGNLTYTYDAAGNRTQIGGTFARTGLPAAVASAVYDAANRLTNWGPTTLTYDNNGNLTSDGTNTYTWNARNQLGSMTGATFVYDGLGRRQKKTIGAANTEFLYDGVNPVQETFGATVLANILTGLGIDEFFSRTDVPAATTSHFLPDGLRSAVALTDPAGAVQTEYTYEPFGKTTATGMSSSNPFQYTGRENDGTGLYYYRARYYHPSLQRFISPDPLLCGELSPTVFLTARFESQGIHQYVYSLNSPVLRTDPLGLTSDCSYYSLRCQQQGGFYYCTVAPTICNNIPGFDCVRQCLQDYDAQRCVKTYGRKDVPGECVYSAHEFCFIACAIRGGNY